MGRAPVFKAKKEQVEHVGQSPMSSLSRWLNTNVCFTNRQTFPQRFALDCSFELIFIPNEKRHAKRVSFRLVRETGLEPVQCELHAPQTCASASSATLAYRSRSPAQHWYYTTYFGNCQYFYEKYFIFRAAFLQGGSSVCQLIFLSLA